MTRPVLLRLLAVIGLLGAGVLLLLPRSDDQGYTVRAIFDNAAFLAQGEDVKVRGAKVGSVTRVSLTASRKAAIDMRITDSAEVPFHTDARCTIRSEGLLAVKFLDCSPGTKSKPQLARDGEGRAELPLAQTSSPIDFDIVTNMQREPAGRQFATLISEFGIGLSGRAEDLNATIRRAYPALDETDKVLAILARQNKDLARFAVDGDSAFRELDAHRRQLAGWVRAASKTAAATAEKSDALGATFERMPRFLTQVRSSMAQLEQATDASLPVFTALDSAAPDLARGVAGLRSFTREGTPALRSLGTLADQGGSDLRRARGLLSDLRTLGRSARPSGADLDALLRSIRGNDGIANLMALFYNGTSTVNGFDAKGHFARIEVLSGGCSEYSAKGFFGCDSHWGPSTEWAKPITEAAPAAAAARTPATTGARPAGQTAALLDYLLAP